jgi:Histidine kinase-like ATPase domain
MAEQLPSGGVGGDSPSEGRVPQALPPLTWHTLLGDSAHVSIGIAAEGQRILRMQGHLTSQAAPAVRNAILQNLADSPPILICDFSEVDLEIQSAPSVFFVIADYVDAWAETPVVLVVPDGRLVDRLHRLQIPNRLTVRSTLEAALYEPVLRLPVRVRRIHLAPTPEAPRLGRAFVLRQARELARPPNEATVELMTSELVTNAVLHAKTDIEVQTTLIEDDRMRISVRDGSPVQPSIPSVTVNLAGDRGRGLALVEAMSRSWGVVPAQHGKIVWCLL